MCLSVPEPRPVRDGLIPAIVLPGRIFFTCHVADFAPNGLAVLNPCIGGRNRIVDHGFIRPRLRLTPPAASRPAASTSLLRRGRCLRRRPRFQRELSLEPGRGEIFPHCTVGSDVAVYTKNPNVWSQK